MPAVCCTWKNEAAEYGLPIRGHTKNASGASGSCIVLALALPPPRVIAQAVIGKERSPFKALKLHAICVEEVARHLRPLLLNGKMARHVRSLVLNGDVRLGYSRGSLLLSGQWQDMSARHC